MLQKKLEKCGRLNIINNNYNFMIHTRIQLRGPEAREVKQFASQFSNREWQILCGNRAFLDSLMSHLAVAAMHATNILKRPVYLSGKRSSGDDGFKGRYDFPRLTWPF